MLPSFLKMSNPKLVGVKDPKRAKYIGHLGGSVKSPAKKLAAKIRELKRKNLMTDQDARDLYEFITDTDLGAAQIYEQIHKLKKFQDPESIARHAKLMIELHKQVHGIKTKATNITANLVVTQEMANVVLDKLFEDLPKKLQKQKNLIIDVEPEQT